MKKLVAIMLVCLLWFGGIGLLHNDQVAKAGDTFQKSSSDTPTTNDDDPYWDDDGTGGTTTP